MERHRTAVAILAAALGLGIVWDAMLRYIPWGVNALVWVVGFVIAAFMVGLRKSGGSAAALQMGFPAIASLLAAGGLVWRDSQVLVALNVVLLVLFLPMLALAARGLRLGASGIAEIAAANVVTGVQSVAGFPQLLFSDLSWSQVPHVSTRRAGIAARGTIIALPALVVFGSLLSSADDGFSKLLADLFVFDVDEVLAHLFVIAVVAAMCAGFLRSLALSGPMPRIARFTSLRLPSSETTFALGLVNALFLLFVITQFRYFFGAAPDALAQYARRGFFELVWVVALVMPMLLVVEWLVDKEKGIALFRTMAFVQIALVFAIAFSAYHRMQLYRDAFGLTRLRFFTTAFMIWVAVLLVWFLVTVLVGRRSRFAIGALASAVAAVVMLHAINPDALIVETNLARAKDGKRAFDAWYAASLSDDAAEVLIANRAQFGEKLSRFIARERTLGWRTWNVSRARAAALIDASGVERDPAYRPRMSRRGIDARVEELAKIRHLQEQVPVADAVHGNGEEQQRQHSEVDARSGSGHR
jgi:hypothetical protein